jgi:LysM repeat protein
VDADTPVQETLEHTVAPGETLSSIAQEQYGAFELWPVILSSNLSELDDPDRLEIGTRLLVPTLEGSAADLSDHDRELVAASYETVSRYYQSRSARRAAFYGRRAARYRAGQKAVLKVSPGP